MKDSSSSSGSSGPSRYCNNCTYSIFTLLCCFHDNNGREHYPEWFSQWWWLLFGWLYYWGQWSWQPLCACFGFMHVCGRNCRGIVSVCMHSCIHSCTPSCTAKFACLRARVYMAVDEIVIFIYFWYRKMLLFEAVFRVDYLCTICHCQFRNVFFFFFFKIQHLDRHLFFFYTQDQGKGNETHKWSKKGGE